MSSSKVALAPFLRCCPAVATLGIRATIDDYSATEKSLLRSADRVFFPTPRFAYLFKALNIPTFPGYHTYRFQRSRVLQQILFACARMPHPITRIYYGKKQKATIPNAFSFPMVAMGPSAAWHQKHLIDNSAALEACCLAYNPVIIQEAVDWEAHLRILWVCTDCIGVLRKDSSQGPTASYEPAPIEHPKLGSVLDMTQTFARKANLDEVVLEWGYARGQWQLQEMARPPVRWPLPLAILNRHHYLCDLVMGGRL